MGRTLNNKAIDCPLMRNADTFGYNARSEVVFSRRGAEGAEYAYSYDDIGNLLLSTFNGTTNTYSANNLNQYTSILCASASLREILHDADGNMTQCGDWTFTYDAANRLNTVSSNNVLLVTNFYDAKSRRVKKVTPEATTTFFHDDWNLIEERVAYTNGTISTIHYYWGKDLSGTLQGAGGVGGLLYLIVSNSNSQLELYIPCYDNNGNITRYLDASGNTVAEYTYDAFGKLIGKSGPLADFFRHRFSTKYYDTETGLYYYGYRFYYPVLMRWLNRDPIEEEGGGNVYVFCGNSALSKSDKLGLKWKIIREGHTFAKAIPCTGEDTFKELAWEIGLDISDYKKWAHTDDQSPIRGKEYMIPNVKVYHKGARRFYENWANNVIGNWDDVNDRLMTGDKGMGFLVILKTNHYHPIGMV